jgi:Mg2+/Co2+ transporter CorB
MTEYIEFNFPPTRFVTENTLGDQLDAVLSEEFEVLAAVMDNYEDLAEAVKDDHVLEEMVDKYHALETFFRKLIEDRGQEFVAALFDRVEQKNRDRGYYLQESTNP